ncbi:DUF4337 domain-containing protein [Andreprevotia chitinilytica]|uniref:DUF4337 domain-containing protein n=1 Tax=Andreprevotia chitinilytica TaxID=396808 RepID=UPI000558D195|nr:DUF4337 domain-containing protein [Andreprevotia chitinilytica]
MSEATKEPWLNQLALVTVILAVCATLSTFKGGGYSTKSLINQQLASDQWAYYQAKSTKQNLYELQIGQLELQLQTLPPNSPALAAYTAKLGEYKGKVAHYDDDRKKAEQTARAFEAERDDAQKHGKPFGLAVIFLQVAILMSSIAALMKRRAIWLAALPLGVVGVAYFFDGFWLFF